MMYHIKLLGHNTQRKKVKMSRDLLSAAHQVLSSNELEIQELVQRVSSARYLDEEQKDQIIELLGFGGKKHKTGVFRGDKLRKGTGVLGRRTTADYDKDKAALDTKRAAASAQRKSKKDAEDREVEKRKKEREAKKRFDASPAGKKKKAQDDAERAAHHAKQDDPRARWAGGMYQDH